MKDKQYLINESELNYLKTFLSDLDPDGGDISLLQQMFNEIDSRPVSMLDRNKVEKELYDMIGGLHEVECGEQVNECVHIASKNICSLVVQPGDREKIIYDIKELLNDNMTTIDGDMMDEDKTYVVLEEFCSPEKLVEEIVAICREEEK